MRFSLVAGCVLAAGTLMAGGAPPAATQTVATVSGQIFLDRDGNGRRDAGEPGVAGIAVSDGARIILTDAQGHYQFAETPLPECVFVSPPETYQASAAFHVWVESATNGADIGLLRHDAGADRTFAFVHGGDIQFDIARQEREWREIHGAIEAIALRYDARFLVCAGDLTPFGTVDDLAATKRVADAGKLPFRPCFGGHDALAPDMPHPKTGNYKRFFGPLTYAWNYGGVHFIALAAEKQFLAPVERTRAAQWLANDLALLPPGAPVILIGHYAPLMEAEIDAIRKNHRLLAILQGHIHAHAVYRADGVPVICSSPWRPLDWGAGTLRTRVIHVQDGAIRTETHAMIATRPPPGPDADAARVDGGLTGWPSYSGPDGRRVADARLKPPLKLAWRIDLGNFQPFPAGTPVIHRQRVCIGLADPDIPVRRAGVLAVRTDTGETVWKTPLPESIEAPVAASGNAIYALGREGTLWALDAETGTIRWTTNLYADADPGNRFAWRQAFAPVVADSNQLYIAAAGRLAAVDAGQGRLLWTQTTGAEAFHATAGLAVGASLAYAVNNAGVAALDRATGGVVWQRTLADLGSTAKSERGCATPLVAGEAVYVPHRGNIARLDASSGARAWNHPVGHYAINAVPGAALSGETLVYARGRYGCAVDTSDAGAGQERWRFESRSAEEAAWGFGQPLLTASTPLIAGSLVVTGSDDGHLYLLDIEDGRQIQAIDLGAPIKGSPACAGNFVCVTDFRGMLYGLTGDAP